MLARGEWSPGSHEKWYQDILAAEDSCSQQEFFKQNWDADLPQTRGADRRLIYTPSDCQLAPFNASTLSRRLVAANTSLLFLGDSLMQHNFAWMRCQLEAAASVECVSHIVGRGEEGTTISCQLVGSSSRIMLYRTNYFGQTWTLTSLIQRFSLERHDILLLSFGAWYFDHFRNGRERLLQHLQEQLLHATRNWPTLMWREPMPMHWPNQVVGNGHTPWCNASRANNGHAAKLQRELYDAFSSKMLIVNTHDPVLPRDDEHPALHFWWPGPKVDFKHVDCTHFLPRSSVNRFVGTALFNAIQVAAMEG